MLQTPPRDIRSTYLKTRKFSSGEDEKDQSFAKTNCSEYETKGLISETGHQTQGTPSQYSTAVGNQDKSGASKRPPRNPFRNTEMTIETRKFEMTAPKQVITTSTAASTRTSSLDNSRIGKPSERPKQVSKIDLGFLTRQNSAKEVFVKNKEAEAKHHLAQQIVDMINRNEKNLQDSDTRLKAYLNQSMGSGKISCITVVDFLRSQWKTRIKNLSAIFELIENRRSAAIPADLLEAVYQTPRSLTQSMELHN